MKQFYGHGDDCCCCCCCCCCGFSSRMKDGPYDLCSRAQDCEQDHITGHYLATVYEGWGARESGRLVRWGLTELYWATPPPGTSALANGPSGTMGGSMYAWEECGATASRAKHWEQALTWRDMDGYVSERGSQVIHQPRGEPIHQD